MIPRIHPSRLLPFIMLFTLAMMAGVREAHGARTFQEGATLIVGVVQDTEGRPLHRATVTMAALRRGATTNAEGAFTIRGLTAGSYQLTVTLLGHAPAHVEVVVPRSGEVVRTVVTMEISPLTIAGVQVTATATGANPLDATQATVELSGKALERNLHPTIAQTLGNEPGVAVRYFGPAATHPVIRGLTGERVLVLHDGQRTGDLASASADHGLSIDPLIAQRVEVVRGPASLLYGSNALGGVVNVISGDIPTSRPTQLEGTIAMQMESVHPGGGLTASTSVPLGDRLAVTLRGGGRRAGDTQTGGGGILENSDFRNLHGVAGLGYVGDRVTGGVAYRTYGFEYGLPAAHDDHGDHGDYGEAGIRIEGLRHEATFRADAPLGATGFTTLRLDGNAHWYTQDEIESNGEIGTSYGLHSQNLSMTSATRLGILSGAAGASALFRQYEAFGEEALTPGANTMGFGLFLFQEASLLRAPAGDSRTPRIQIGARYDRHRIKTVEGIEDRFGPARVRDFDNFSGSVGLNLPFGNALSLGLSAAQAFRAPALEELFSDAFHPAVGTYDIGDPDLLAETSRGLESVLRGQSSRTNVQIAAFYNRVDNFITPILGGDTTVVDEHDGEEVTVPIAFYSQGDVTLRGVEGQVETIVAPRFVLGAMGDLVRGAFNDGSPIPFMPATRLGASARWDDGRRSMGAELRHAFAQDRVQHNELATGAYTLVHLNAGFTHTFGTRVHSVTLRADNLLDREYRDAASRIKALAPNPGRNIGLVYRLLF